jgi:hypothetical protein
MVTPDNTDIVLQTLVDLWVERLPSLAHHLQDTFGYSHPSSFTVDRLFIAQMADGNVASGDIGGKYSRKWVLREGVLRLVPLDYAYDEMYVQDQNGETYVSPSFLFCVEGDEVLLSERYGPSLKHRLRGRIQSGRQSQIEWTSIWKSCVD